MTPRQSEVLQSLRWFTDNGIRHSWHRKWARPMDVGGSNGSHHGATLMKLAKLGFAEADVWRVGSRRTFRYKISAKGREFLAEVKSQCQ